MLTYLAFYFRVLFRFPYFCIPIIRSTSRGLSKFANIDLDLRVDLARLDVAYFIANVTDSKTIT